MTTLRHPLRTAASLLWSLCALAGTAHASNDVFGALEIGPRYSAIHTMSEATGDPVAYVVRNDSAPGRRILANCLEPLFCRVQALNTRDSDNGPQMGFKEGASGWLEILEASSPRMERGVKRTLRADTRFGPLGASEREGLRWRDQPVLPEMKGDMAFVGRFEIGDAASGSDVVLVQTETGAACARTLHFLVVSAKGVSASEPFGTCSDLFRAVQAPNSPVVTVHMVGYQGRLDPANPLRNTIRNQVTYQFQNGKLTRQAAK